ncbi:MAG: hypothetical protein ACC608_09380 [Anaerofustis sp.]
MLIAALSLLTVLGMIEILHLFRKIPSSQVNFTVLLDIQNEKHTSLLQNPKNSLAVDSFIGRYDIYYLFSIYYANGRKKKSKVRADKKMCRYYLSKSSARK